MEPDSSEVTQPRSKTQRILDELNAGEGKVAQLAALVAAKLAQRPHAALVVTVLFTALVFWAGVRVGRP